MKSKVILLTLALCLLFSKNALAFDVGDYVMSNINLFPLRGIKKIHVAVIPLHKEATALGLNEKELKTLVEENLKERKITTCEEYEVVVRNYPVLAINVNVAGPAYNIRLCLDERVVLFREKSVNCIATIWDRSFLGNHGNDAGVIKSSLSQLLAQFIKDYYSINPKK